MLKSARFALSAALLFANAHAFAIEHEDIKYTSWAIFNDLESSSTLTINALDEQIDEIKIRLYAREFPIDGPQFIATGFPNATTEFVLKDDGTNGDLSANDGIFTLENIRTDSEGMTAYGYIGHDLELEYGGVKRSINFPKLVVTNKNAVRYENLSSTILVSDRFINIHSVPQSFINSTEQISKTFYEWFEDEYDFLLMYRENTGGKAHFLDVANEVTGIGKSIFNSRSNYGAVERLSGIAVFGPPPGIQMQGLLSKTVNHEFAHNWGVDLDLPFTDYAHWNIDSTVRGLLGGGYWLRNPDGSFTKESWRQLTAHPVELYLMGAISAEELDQIGDMWFLQDEMLDQVGLGESIFPKHATQYYTQDIIDEVGIRVPSTGDSQRFFRTATIFATSKPMTLEEAVATNHVLEFYSRQRRYDVWINSNVSSFYGATLGHLVMNYEFSKPKTPISLPGLSGLWFNPERNYEGFEFQILEDDEILMIFYTYPGKTDDELALQSFILGVGTIEGNTATITDAYRTSGPNLNDYKKEDLVIETWGDFTVEFYDQNNARVQYIGRDGIGSTDVTRLTNLATKEEVGSTKSALSAAWFNPESNGQGWFVEVLSESRAIVYWYTYDDNGNQIWSFGDGRFDGNSIVVDAALSGVGSKFGDQFYSEDVTLAPIAEFILEFESCVEGNVVYKTGKGSISRTEPIVRLATLSGHNCDD